MDAFEQLTLRNIINDFEKLKKNISEWVVALDSRQYALEQELKALKGEISMLKHTSRWNGSYNNQFNNSFRR